tara:strand:+ start:3750 stop:4694 length:945 start_codon:yes stop_codon:yes gene_type:complete
MNWSTKNIPNLTSKTILITGGNSGLGFESARILLSKNANILLACRTEEKANLAKEKLIKLTGKESVYPYKMDLSDLRSVSETANTILQNHIKLDILINNAGIMAPPRAETKQGLEMQFGVNHLAHMALTLKLLPLLAKNQGSKIITITSGAHFFGKINWEDLQSQKRYDKWSAYAQSKLANIMFAIELHSRENQNLGISSISAHPGIAKTNLFKASNSKKNLFLQNINEKLFSPFFQSAEMGALPQIFAATSEKARSGNHYGPKYNFRGYPALARTANSVNDRFCRKKLWVKSLEILKEIEKNDREINLLGNNQ